MSNLSIEQLESIVEMTREQLRLAKGRRVQVAGHLASPERKAAQVARFEERLAKAEANLAAAKAAEGNPVVKTTPLQSELYPGWVIREYRNGMFDAAQVDGPGLSPGFSSFDECLQALRAELRAPGTIKGRQS